MSSSDSQEPAKKNVVQTDEQLFQANVSAADASTKAPRCNVAAGVGLVFCFLLCFAGVYLERHSGDYSVSAYTETRQASGGTGSGPKAVDMVAFGKKQYLSQCVTCHQPNGLGTPGTYPPLAGSEWVIGSEDRAVRIVLHGLIGQITVAGQTYPGTTAMPSFGKVPNSGYNWRDDQVAAVLTYVRQEWGNKAPAITTEKVAEIRTKEPRDKPWTAPELLAIK
jgi:mono/diheme cytochrome c family protein